MDKSKIFMGFMVLMIVYINVDLSLSNENYLKTAKGAIDVITQDHNFTGGLLVPLRSPNYVYNVEDFRQICLEMSNSKIYYYDFGDYLHLFVTNATITDVIEVERGSIPWLARGTVTWLDWDSPLYGIKIKIERQKIGWFPLPMWKWRVINYKTGEL